MTMLQQYEDRLPLIRRTAYGLGYSIGLHGSGERDLDLIAVPWVDNAAVAEELVEAIRLEVDGVILDGVVAGLGFENPAYRPHGRRSWAIQIGGGLYIDLSVMPLARGDNDGKDTDVH